MTTLPPKVPTIASSARQTSSPSQLELLAVIKTQNARTAKQLEGTLHQQFAQLHISGEWFKAEKTLLNYLKEVTVINADSSGFG